jgi:hypothetical protein
MNMIELWIEETNGAGLKVFRRKLITSRRRRRGFNPAACLERAVTFAMYAWAVVLSVAVAAVLIKIWG